MVVAIRGDRHKITILAQLLGIWLLINGAAYIATSVVSLLFPQDLDLVGTITQPALFGELAIMLCLSLWVREKEGDLE